MRQGFFNYIAIFLFICYMVTMNEIKRKGYNTTIRVDLIRELKILAAEKDCRVNDLLEEAIFDILSKHGKTPPE
ncbi:hypothetical protein DSCW_35670 [Desulfosarcina widdelii]|uniref:Antitoxin-like ribbon-helix-helix domain-containing protein n=2 Tax=Desulfosarcina widdelii TaxID=947919 RepID=A0A5K7Z5Y5_9BACT|nr:hypothetical protein DSCW_35670 [Desulfosarcina widdelii]